MHPKDKNKNHRLPSGLLRLRGAAAELLERVADNRFRSEAARTRVYREAEDAFRSKQDDASGVYGLWQGEFWGKWMIGAVRYCEYSHDAGLREFIRKGVHTLLTLQEPSGYLGTYRDPMNLRVADPAAAEPLIGWTCNWNWNIWCRKYTLWGLLEAWRLLEEPEILEAAERLAAHLIRSLHEHRIRLGATGTFAGIPSGSILKPMVLLYRATGRQEFLDFAREIADDWDRSDDLCPNLIANARSDRFVHTWYPEPKNWAKAYEMLSCFDGLLELGRITGEPELLEAAIGFHALLKRGEYNPLFSVGFNDIFAGAAFQLNAITEPCDVIHWMRLCHELFLETGDTTYLDDFEAAFYNPFLAAVCRNGAWGARGVRSHGRHLFAFEQAGCRYNHCCVNNIPRGFLNLAETAITTCGNTVSVNLYPECDAAVPLPDGGTLKLAIDGDYPVPGQIRIRTETGPAPAGFLRLRIPGWAENGSLETARNRQTGTGRWFELPIPRGRSELKLHFHCTPRLREHRPPPDMAEWYHLRWHEPGMEQLFRTEPGSTLTYGPLLLARSRLLGNSEAEMFGPPLPPGSSCVLRPLSTERVRHAFEAEFHSGGQSLCTKVCDYASAGNVIQENQRLFSVFF